MGSTLTVIVRIRNLTASDVSSIIVYDVDSLDFGPLRPDKVFVNNEVPVNGCLEKTMELSRLKTKYPFTMKLQFGNGKEDVFRMNFKGVFEGKEADLRYITKTHNLKFVKAGPRVLEIIVENTEKQLKNFEAEKLISAGCKLMENGRFNQASVKFMEAAEKANEKETIIKLHEKTCDLKILRARTQVDKQTKSLNMEGLKLLGTFQFRKALNQLEEALKLAEIPETRALIEDNLKIVKEAKLNDDVKKLIEEALILKENKQHDAALLKFDEALKLKNDTVLLSNIKRNKIEILNAKAAEILDEAWLLDETIPENAIHYFYKAKYLYQEANQECKDIIYLINLRLEGGKLLNEAIQLQNQAKYSQAQQCYKKAQKTFEEGVEHDSRFEKWLDLTNIALKDLEIISNETT